jgi:hypothetical protein
MLHMLTAGSLSDAPVSGVHSPRSRQPADQQPQNSPNKKCAMHLVVLVTHKKPRQRVMQEKIRQELIAVLMACSN